MIINADTPLHELGSKRVRKGDAWYWDLKPDYKPGDVAEKRLKILDVLLREEDYSDVVREAQEIVEPSLKGMLRHVGIEPPNYHDLTYRRIFC